eukprot:766693-Hanusia_phi.AAC.6
MHYPENAWLHHRSDTTLTTLKGRPPITLPSTCTPPSSGAFRYPPGDHQSGVRGWGVSNN